MKLLTKTHTCKGKLLTTIALLLLLAITAPLMTGCGTMSTAEELSACYVKGDVSGKAPDEAFGMAQTEFSLSLLKAVMEDKPEDSILLSPLSVTLALAMTANGSAGNTRTEMEKVLGGEIPLETLNEYLYSYAAGMPAEQVKTANSIWLRQDGEPFTVSRKFLQTNADYYAAQVYRTPFDKSLPEKMNTWVSERTDGMIEELLKKAPEKDVFMYLVNALLFEGRWKEEYQEHQVLNGTFRTASGQAQQVEMMHSTEYLYLESDNAVGFIKPYEDDRFAFAALLPKEGLSLQDYVQGLTAETLSQTLSSAKSTNVKTALPKFQNAFELSLADTLRRMGIKDAFDFSVADFSNMVEDHSPDGRIYISEVLHKTYMEVAEQGTKAGAVTSVEFSTTSSPIIEAKVILDRPFVYMILDTQTNLPLFIGTLTSVGE